LGRGQRPCRRPDLPIPRARLFVETTGQGARLAPTTNHHTKQDIQTMDQQAGDALFARKRPVDALWQEIALNFYPERADFTTRRSEGEDYAAHLFTSYPVVARRELGNLFSSNLRPRSTKWFALRVEDETLDQGTEERRYLDYLAGVQWRAMYDPQAQFVRATKEGDHDFAAFGNAVIRGGPNVEGNGLLFTCYHLRDTAWSENAEGRVDLLHRDWTPTARQLRQHFGEKVSRVVDDACRTEPEKAFACRQVVLPSRLYNDASGEARKFPFVSLTIERDSETVLEEIGLSYFPYVVPRWQTVSGSPYGRSMATGIALPDGRTMQVLVRVLREAGEKFVDPPMIAVMDAIRSDIALYAGGVTTADIEYDERLGEVLRPIAQDRGGMPIGFEIAEALREDIRAAFFLDKIQLPQFGSDMTAFEVRRRIEEHIRAASPLFEPIEQDYNTPLCELAFDVLRSHGAFGPIELMPESLRGADVRFTFCSPLADMSEQNDADIYRQTMETIVKPAAEVDPALLALVNLDEAVPDAMRASGFKAKWMNGSEAVVMRRRELEEQQKMQAGMAALATAADTIERGGRGAKALIEADVMERAGSAAGVSAKADSA
jgi:hypothetical protein